MVQENLSGKNEQIENNFYYRLKILNRNTMNT